MEVANRQGRIEEMSMHPVNSRHYLRIAQKAIYRLHWSIISVSPDSIICQAGNTGSSPGEVIRIAITGEKVLFQGLPGDNDNLEETEHRNNFELYKKAASQVIEEQEKANRSIHPMHREKYGALVPSKSYAVTPIIVYGNAIVFVAMVIAGISPLHPSVQSLFEWGGNFRSAVVHGEWWRLITYMFLHGGAVHLLMNTFALLYIGMFLEPLLGRFRFASAYLITGVCAGLMSITVHQFSVGVGASGAIFGMYGVFLSMLTTSHIQKTMRKTMLRSILFFVVLNLLYGLQGNTDNAAHIGGLLSGLIIGYVYYPGIAKHNSLKQQAVTTAIFASAVILLVMFACNML